MNERGSEESYVHRIEAFSDIVIGFTVAQIGATLVLPTHATALLGNGLWFVIYLWTFALVCLMWWLHNRVFRTVFVPTTWSVLCNFALLASIVIMVYFAEVLAHARTIDDAAVASRLYYLTFSVTVALVSTLSWMGLSDRGERLDSQVRTKAVRSAVVNTVAAAFIMVSVAASLVHLDTIFVPWLGVVALFGFALGNVVARVGRFGTPSS
ncbi:MAG TPA: TMEM175 family protein [Candidatus Baltobacteraceae bacterium]|nr:TMEM175 family protein [Candidatus Baltobacteraceae bacterium]